MDKVEVWIAITISDVIYLAKEINNMNMNELSLFILILLMPGDVFFRLVIAQMLCAIFIDQLKR